MPMNLKQMIKNKLFEVEQPQSEGEKNFKALHRAVNHKNLVPGITDQDHIFNGSTKPYDNKHHTGYKPGEDRAAYDKTLRLHDDETNNGYETAKVSEDFVAEASLGGHEELKKYAYEHGGIDRDDMLRAAHHIEHGNIEGLKHRLDNMDTDPRDFVLQHVHKGHWNKLGFYQIPKRVHEAIGSMIGKTRKQIGKTASFGDKDVNRMMRDEKQRKAKAEAETAKKSVRNEEAENIEEKNWIQNAVKKPGALTMAAKKAGMPNAEYEKKHVHDSGKVGKRARLAMTLKNLHHKEEVEILGEASWVEKNIPPGDYNRGGNSEKGDIHHVEVHPETLKKHAIIHQVTHDGEYGPTHHFEHPTHGKVSVYQSGLNTKTGNPIVSVRTFGPQGAKPVARHFASKLKGKTMHAYNEEVNENYDDTPEEVSMVRAELKAMIADAQSLLDNMPSNMHIEPWVQSKIAIAKSMVNGVHDYMLYSDDTDKPADMRSTMSSMANPFGTNEEVDLDEKLSPEQLKKFGKLAPPYDKITHADKIVAIKKKEAGHKVLPEASALGSECTKCGEGHYKEIDGKMICDECGNVAKAEMKEASVIKSHAMNMAKQSMHILKKKMKPGMHVKMKSPKKDIKMEEVILSDNDISLIETILNSTEE